MLHLLQNIERRWSVVVADELVDRRGLKEAFEAVLFHIIFLLEIFEFYFRIFKKMSARQDRTSDPV